MGLLPELSKKMAQKMACSFRKYMQVLYSKKTGACFLNSRGLGWIRVSLIDPIAYLSSTPVGVRLYTNS